MCGGAAVLCVYGAVLLCKKEVERLLGSTPSKRFSLLLLLLFFHYVVEQASSTGLGACFFFFLGVVDLTLALVGDGFVVEVGVAGCELGRSVATLFHVLFHSWVTLTSVF